MSPQAAAELGEGVTELTAPIPFNETVLGLKTKELSN